MSAYSKEPLHFLMLPKGYFDKHFVKILEGMPNGNELSYILLKLFAESISHGGYLRYSETKPYTPQMLAAVVRADEATVEAALKAYSDLGISEADGNGTIFFPMVREMTKTTTEGAMQKDSQRTNGGQTADKCPIEYRVLEYRCKMIEQDKTRYKQPGLLTELAKTGFLDEGDLEDPQWDSLLDGWVSKKGIVDLKIKLKYIIGTISSIRKLENPDKEGKPIFRRVVREGMMPESKFGWLAAALNSNFAENEDGKPF